MAWRSTTIGALIILAGLLLVQCGNDNGTSGTSGVEGTWEGTLTYAGHSESPSPLRLQLTKGDTGHEGSLQEYNEDVWWSFTIVNCVITGDAISFSIDEKEQIPEETEYWNFVGSISGDTMSGEFTSVDGEGESGTWEVTRQ